MKSRVKEFFNKLSGEELAMHPSYLCAYEGDLRIPIQQVGGDNQELLFLLRHLTEDGLISGIEEPGIHYSATIRYLPRICWEIFNLCVIVEDDDMKPNSP